MALRRMPFLQTKSMNPSRLILFFFYTDTSPHRRNPSFLRPNSLPQFSISYHSSENATPILSDHPQIVDRLTTIFTKQPFLRDSEELRNLGARLTTETVETVLRGLKSWKIGQEFFSWAAEQEGYKHNCYTYNAMASFLSQARQCTHLRILAMDVLNSRCSMTPGALGFFIRCLGSQGLFQEAISLFDQAKMMGLCVPNNYTYNCLLEALSKSSSVDLVEERLREMRDLGWEPDKFTLTPVLQVYCNARMFGKALAVFDQIYDKGWVDVRVFAILVLSFSKWGEVDKAFELIERMEDLNISFNEKTFCVLIHGFVRESRVDRALQLFDKMRKSGFCSDISIYDMLIGGLCKKKDLNKALDLYLEMKGCGIFPDVGIITKLISSFCGEGDMVTANRLLEESREGLDVKAVVLLYNAILDGLVNHGLVNKAYLLLQAMMGAECSGEAAVDNLFGVKETVLPNPTSFNIVMDGLCKKGELDLALRLFRDMVRMGCACNLLLYNNLIDELCKSDRLEEAFELLRDMKGSGFEPTQFTHNSIFGCLCRREDVAGALDLVREMRAHGHEPWTKHSSLLVKQLCTHGKAVKAYDFLTDMVQEGFLPDMIAYSAAIDGFFKIREVDRALELFQDICSRGYCPDMVAYNILINGLCKAERVSEAKDVLDKMLDKGLVPSVVTYNIMIDGWCKTGEVDQAFLCLSRMVLAAREPTVITYTTLIDGLCNAGRPDDALVLWNEMEGKGCSPNRITYMAFIHGLCKCNRADAALLYFREMEEKEMRPVTSVYVALISAFVSNLNPCLAFEILKEMVQKGNIPVLLDKNYPLLNNAICKLSEDSRTSSDVKNLVAEGCIPTIHSASDIRDGGWVDPVD
ncbi:hypothetical protein HHK36_024067 [Tetracentron sinense]|uniref:PROP1-like PPR domain-containing protein n=1 Tax=Tetracentron sinense TaxID=13715 RepID=A0A835D4A8_TETSI|nr:hypothetical protein HHK36_024067 [Tetracentron sinense]